MSPRSFLEGNARRWVLVKMNSAALVVLRHLWHLSTLNIRHAKHESCLFVLPFLLYFTSGYYQTRDRGCDGVSVTNLIPSTPTSMALPYYPRCNKSGHGPGEFVHSITSQLHIERLLPTYHRETRTLVARGYFKNRDTLSCNALYGR